MKKASGNISIGHNNTQSNLRDTSDNLNIILNRLNNYHENLPILTADDIDSFFMNY